MTTFEITIIVLLAAIVILLILAFAGMATINAKMQEGFQYLGKKILDCTAKLGYINGATQDISRQLDNIESNNDQDFEKLTDIVDKMHRNLCVEIADKMVDRVYKQPTSVNGTPCYAPDSLVAELKRNEDVCVECHRMDAINTASVCENMTKIQKELQNKGV